MEWSKLLNFSRFGTDGKPPESECRSEPDRDADRIIFSGAFRRLNRKTQVHPLAANDHIRTRLTHSLEVGRVGNSLGRAVYNRVKEKSDLPGHVSAADFGAIVQAACLAHDIGNPPFGHAGEEAMMHWFNINSGYFNELRKCEYDDVIRFDGNAQGFRILTQTENNLFHGGLQLTYATLATYLKYPNTPTSNNRKFSVFLSEKEILDEVAEVVGLPHSPSSSGYLRHPLAYLAEAADDICYCVLDLEDAVELKILQFEDIEKILLAPFNEEQKASIRARYAPTEMFRVNLARLRGPVFDYLIAAAVEGFIKVYDDIMADHEVEDVFSSLGKDDTRAKVISECKKLGREKIYTDTKKLEVEIGCFSTLDTLLTDFMSASKANANHLGPNKSELDWKSRLVMNLLGEHAPNSSNAPPGKQWTYYLCYRRAIDYISGMTDNYATYIAKQLKGMAYTGMQRP